MHCSLLTVGSYPSTDRARRSLTTIEIHAIATARRNTIMAEAAAYADAQSTLGLTPAQLQSYRWFHTMMEEDNGGKVLVNMEGGQIVNV